MRRFVRFMLVWKLIKSQIVGASNEMKHMSFYSKASHQTRHTRSKSLEADSPDIFSGTESQRSKYIVLIKTLKSSFFYFSPSITFVVIHALNMHLLFLLFTIELCAYMYFSSDLLLENRKCTNKSKKRFVVDFLFLKTGA